MFLKDSTGQKSVTVTLAIIAFTIVMLKVIFSGARVAAGNFTYTFGTIGAEEIAAILGTTLGTYAFRRHTDQKFADKRVIER